MTTSSLSIAAASIAVVILVLALLLRRRPQAKDATSLQPESQFIVRVDDSEISCERPDGHMDRIRWNDLQTVVIETTDAGPFASDVFWLLIGNTNSSGCVIPQGATGDTVLLERLQQLPGFDNEAFIRAMSSTDNEKFTCWRRTQ